MRLVLISFITTVLIQSLAVVIAVAFWGSRLYRRGYRRGFEVGATAGDIARAAKFSLN